jgi:hypothetical protein
LQSLRENLCRLFEEEFSTLGTFLRATFVLFCFNSGSQLAVTRDKLRVETFLRARKCKQKFLLLFNSSSI